jgi:hypothetical protein
MRIVGNIGERLNINIDYNDTYNKKDISLIYKGQAGEFVQEAAFGDISVSLPSTEFTGYSKELFGLKVDTAYKNLNLNAFFSKTKGLSEIKRFVGNNQLERRKIADTAYIKLKYYSLLKNGETKKIKNGTVQIFVDYQKLDTKYNILITTNTILHNLNPTSTSTYTYKGNFVLLVAGQDYTVDYNAGIIFLKTSLKAIMSLLLIMNLKMALNLEMIL